MAKINTRHPVEGAIVYEEGIANTRYIILAQSLSKQSVFMRRQVKEGYQWNNTAIFAIAPLHRISIPAESLEPGPWLQLFNTIEARVIAAA